MFSLLDIDNYKYNYCFKLITVEILIGVSKSIPPSTLKPQGGPPTSTIGKAMLTNNLDL